MGSLKTLILRTVAVSCMDIICKEGNLQTIGTGLMLSSPQHKFIVICQATMKVKVLHGL